MENSQTVPLVAIAISLVALVLSFVAPITLQSDIRNLNNDLINQSNEIKSLTNDLSANSKLIQSQNVIIDKLSMQQNSSLSQITSLQTNVTNMENQINSLDNRITLLEQKIQPLCLIPEGCPLPTPSKPVYFPGVLKFYNAADGGGTDQNRVWKHLPSTLPSSNWIAYFDYNFTSSSIPAAYPLALTSTSVDPEQQGSGEDAILVYHGDNSDVLHIRIDSVSTTTDSPGLYTGIPISPNKLYFVKLERTQAQIVLSVFSDSARAIQVPGSPIMLDIASNDLNNLNFVQHATSLSSGSGRTVSATVDNLQIYVKGTNGDNKILFHDDYSSSSGWNQVGSSVAVNGSFVSQMPRAYDYIRSLP